MFVNKKDKICHKYFLQIKSCIFEFNIDKGEGSLYNIIITKRRFLKMTQLTIYRQVAKAALMSWNGLSEEEAEKAVTESTFDELEGQVWATGSLSYAVDAIAKIYGMNEEEKATFTNIVIDKENAFIPAEHQEFLSKMQEKEQMFGGDKCVLAILSAIHDGWVKDNGKKFNQEGREGKRYQHLPLMLIGWKEAKADLLFLAPIIKQITKNYELSEESLKQTYENRVPSYLEKKGIDTKSKLVSKIMEGSDFYAPLTEKNTAQDATVATAMADKVLEVNPMVSVVLKSTNK